MTCSDVIAIIALVVSILALVYQVRSNKNALERDLYSNAFREYLMVRIPEGRNHLHLTNGRVSSKTLQKCLSSLLKDALYFKFKNSVFYETLQSIILDIDDLVVSINNEPEEQEKTKKLKEIDYSINRLYDEISDVYIKGNH